MKSLALSLALPLLVGPLTFAVMQGLKRVSAWVDAQSAFVKRLAVAGIALVLTLLSTLTGVTIPCEAEVNCLAVLDHDTVKALVGAVVALAMHRLKVLSKQS
jgi:hypothetical protein